MNRSTIRPRPARLVVVLVALGIILGATAATVQGQPSAETSVSITVVDKGALTIDWGSADVAFLVDGETPSLTAVNPSPTATANFSLTIDDTRTDENRSGYAITIQADAFTAGGAAAMSPGQLSIAGLAGLPDTATDATTGQALDAPVTVLTVPAGAEAVSGTLTVTVAMTIPPGTTPGTYHGSLILEVLPLTGP